MASPVDATGRRLLLLGSAAWSFVPVVVAPPDPGSDDGYAPGIYFPATLHYSSAASAYMWLGSGFARFASGKAQKWTLGGPDAALFILVGLAGASLYVPEPPSAFGRLVDHFDLVVSVTDGTTTYSQAVVVLNSAQAVLQDSNVMLDTSPTGYYGNATGDAGARKMGDPGDYSGTPGIKYGWAGGAATFNDPAGILQYDPGLGYLASRSAAEPFSGKYGAHNGASFTVAGTPGYTQAAPYWVVRERPTDFTFTIPRPFSTSAPVGTAIGTLDVFSDAGVQRVDIIGGDGSLGIGLSVVGYRTRQRGDIRVAGPMTAGTGKTLTVRATSFSGMTSTKTFTYDVLAGTVLPGANMTLARGPALDNGMVQPLVGTPAVTGIPGTKRWSFTNIDNVVVTTNGPASSFTIDPTTGVLTGTNMLAAREGGHSVTITCTDGVNTCSQAFSIPVAWMAGPTLHVGRGMAAAHPGAGFDHFSDLMQKLSYAGDGYPYKGATVYWHADSDPEYFSNDCANGLGAFPENALTRFGLYGPLRFINADMTGPLVRVGGALGSPFGGYDMAEKGFFNIAAGDFYMQGFWVNRVMGKGYPPYPNGDLSHGMSGVRKNAATFGDFMAEDCVFSDCNNGFEGAEGPLRVTIRRCLFFNCGGQTVSSGQTHAAYIAGADLLYEDNVSVNNNIGHCLKVRSENSVVRYNTLGDGEGGSTSQCLNIPQGGNHDVHHNTFHKGPNQQNPACVGVLEDSYGLDRKLVVNLHDNTFVVAGVLGHRSGQPTGIFHFPRRSFIDGTESRLISSSNAFYLSPGAQRFQVQPTEAGAVNTWEETGTTILSAPPALSFGYPGNGQFTGGIGFFPDLFFYGDDIANMDFVQQRSDVKDIRIPASTAAGTTIATLGAYGSDLWKIYAVANDIRVNPFVAGTTWSITRDGNYFSGAVWAPPGRYSVVANSDGTAAQIKVAGALVAGLDFLKVRATAPNGTVSDWRYYIVVL